MLSRMNGLLCLTICMGLFLSRQTVGAVRRTAPTDESKIKPLGRLIGAFKTISTKQINFIRKTSGVPFWQRNFYEHVIRDDQALNRIREYITTNPLRWDLDRENPQAREGMNLITGWLPSKNHLPTLSLP